MEWTVIAALGLLGVAIVAGLFIAVVTSVSKYAKQLTEKPKDPRRGFEVKQTNTADTQSVAQREKDDHHG